MAATVMVKWCLVAIMIVLQGAFSTVEGENEQLLSRDKRQACAKTTEELTMANFITLVKKIESHSSMKSEPLLDVANMLRSRFAAGNAFYYFLGESSVDWNDKLLTASEKEVLLRMIVHSDDSSTNVEKGVVRTAGGDTVAVGHVIKGIMAALDRDTDHTLGQLFKGTDYKLDNLYVVTISGDLGQTTKTKYTGVTSALIGPGGSWNSACPKQYILSGPASEATNAEVLGDLDGFVLGSGVDKWRHLKLSQVFEQYYGTGIAKDRRLKASQRVENFNQLVVDLELIYQSHAFLEAYDSDAAKKYKSKIPSTVASFYGQTYMKASSCPNVIKQKYTVGNFIDVVKKIEATTSGIKQTVNAILGLSEQYTQSYFDLYLNGLGSRDPVDGFDWYSIYGLIYHKVDATFRREVGLLLDNDGYTLAIGHVLAGISAGMDRKTSSRFDIIHGILKADNLFGATIAGDLYELGRSLKHGPPKFGPRGSWDSSCPPRYSISTGSPVTAASCPEIFGDIDGLILGHVVAGTSLKLSELLTQYYGSGLASDNSVSSKKRTAKFRTLAPQSKVAEQVGMVCVDSKGLFSSLDCDALKNTWSDAFYKEFLSTPSGSGNLYNGGRLPAIKSLRSVFPGQTTDAAMYVLAGVHQTPASRPDVLRISYMLNQLEGHYIHPSTQGGVQGNGSKHYLVSASDMERYLTSRYGSPVKVTSQASISGKPGITKRGSMALWDGASTISGSGEISLWEARSTNPSGDCSYLAERGNCEFYLQCLETTLGCKDTDYPRAYGHKYCSKFGTHIDKFNAEGRAWVDDVRVCLMKALLPHRRNPSMTCGKIKEIAFNSHVNCYIQSGVGFCKVMASTANWDALYAVYEVGDFFSADWRHAWGQVVQTLKRCVTNDKSQTASDAAPKVNKFKVLTNDKVSAAAGVDSAAQSAASKGDCAFYEHFETRFPCADSTGESHMTDVELPLCLQGYRQDGLMTSAGWQWYENYQKCLTSGLLPLYQGSDVTCTPLRLTVYEKRLECMESSGLCDVLIANEFALDQWTAAGSFPYILPNERFRKPVDRSETLLKPIYFWNALDLKVQLVDALALCAKKGSLSQSVYDNYVRTRGVQPLR